MIEALSIGFIKFREKFSLKLFKLEKKVEKFQFEEKAFGRSFQSNLSNRCKLNDWLRLFLRFNENVTNLAYSFDG